MDNTVNQAPQTTAAAPTPDTAGTQRPLPAAKPVATPDAPQVAIKKLEKEYV
jgi:hypothetical protein